MQEPNLLHIRTHIMTTPPNHHCNPASYNTLVAIATCIAAGGIYYIHTQSVLVCFELTGKSPAPALFIKCCSVWVVDPPLHYGLVHCILTPNPPETRGNENWNSRFPAASCSASLCLSSSLRLASSALRVRTCQQWCMLNSNSPKSNDFKQTCEHVKYPESYSTMQAFSNHTSLNRL